jgi:hypothetical protein
MSALETSAKSVLIPLLDRSQTTISREVADVLANWATVKSIVGEHATEATALTPLEDRRAVYDGKLIPSYFRIFLAFHSLQTQTAYFRHSTTVSTTMAGPKPALVGAIHRNIQATTFLVGPLCFYVAAARVTGLSTSVLDPIRPMYRLWPEPASTITLGSSIPLAESDVYAVSRSLNRVIRDPRFKYGGPLPKRDPNAT